MVIRELVPARRAWHGSLITEMAVAMVFLLAVIIPLAYSFAREQKLVRASYLRTVAMEVVDGEMEILVAGEWRAFQSGTQSYSPARPVTNLPEGDFSLTINGKHLRLEWRAAKPGLGGKVIREVTVK